MIDLFLLAAGLIAKHTVCDYVLQTPKMLNEKGIYGARGGLEHSGLHALFTLMLVTVLFGPVYGLILAVLDGVVHYHTDWAKQQLSKGLMPSDSRFWVWFGLDQTVHYLTYLAILLILAYTFR